MTGTTVENSPFTKADHVLALPSHLALESLKKVNESKLMTLLVMLYFEEGAFSNQNLRLTSRSSLIEIAAYLRTTD